MGPPYVGGVTADGGGRYGCGMDAIILVTAIVIALAVAALAVHLALTFADRRGWVFYRNPNRTAPRSLGLLEEIYQPSTAHVIEQDIVEDSLADVTESGDLEEPDPPELPGENGAS